MENYITACASTITQLIAEVSSGDVYVLACNENIVKSWHVMRNQKPPSTRELLYYYQRRFDAHDARNQGSPQVGAQRSFLCVSDMNTETEDLLCPDVNWITSKSGPAGQYVGRVSWNHCARARFFRILSVGGNDKDIKTCRRLGYKIKDEEEMDKQPTVSILTTKTNKTDGRKGKVSR